MGPISIPRMNKIKQEAMPLGKGIIDRFVSFYRSIQ